MGYIYSRASVRTWGSLLSHTQHLSLPPPCCRVNAFNPQFSSALLRDIVQRLTSDVDSDNLEDFQGMNFDPERELRKCEKFTLY